MSKAEQQFRMESKPDQPHRPGKKPIQQWQSIPWHSLERRVYKLQKRIYLAASRGDLKTVRQLQKTLLKSWSAKCIAVRKVTQDNQGKKTPGIDGVKSLTPNQRLTLVNSLKLTHLAKPTRRVWIPKPGTQEKRPLGIPTIGERALQALVKMALEPEWEARFEPHSYGFRPGRGVHDAIKAISQDIKQKAKYVLDADICKCFDRINHEALLTKINTFPTMRRQIKAWLKAGVMDAVRLFPTSEGTPQGGVISPLLANIALHGMEEVITQAFKRKDYKIDGKRVTVRPPKLIRYADDFVIIHEDIAVVTKCQLLIASWLHQMGLELKPSKTRLTHTLNAIDGVVGFDFLGFHIQQHPVGNYRSVKTGSGKVLGFKTFITPSKEKVKQHLRDIGRIIDAHKTAPQAALIDKLNPLIRGWANYYSTVNCRMTFSKVDFLTYQKLRTWARSRCVKSNQHETVNKYWRTVGSDNWRFCTPDGHQLAKHSDTAINKYIQVKGSRSPYDGDWVYWSSRRGRHPLVPKRIALLLKKQKGKCAGCGLFFKDGDLIEVDHITPQSLGGRDEYKNLQLLHRHCHDVKTKSDGSLTKTWLTQEEKEVNPL